MEAGDSLENIPEELYCFTTGKPFEKCSDCERSLLEPGVLYMVEKAIRQYDGYSAKDVIFECAICLGCAERIKDELSEESLSNMIRFYQEMMTESEHLSDEYTFDKCVVTGTPKEQLMTYQVNALCEGAYLSPLQPPYLISASVLDDMNEILSDSTRDFLEDYQQKIIGPAPEWITDDVPGGKLVLI
ncbi:MAG: hypothetical protein WBA74_17990 [Cyclobacteriaceae bacterium]